MHETTTPMTGKRLGYIRVSTTDQNPDRQLDGFDLHKRFIDYASASSTNRPQLKVMLDFAREDDIVIVHSMDRLARNLRDLKSLVDNLISRKVQVYFVKENLIFSQNNSSMSNLMLHMMGAFAEFEYDFIRERQREGIEIAKKKGAFKGRTGKLTQEMRTKIIDVMQTRKPRAHIAEELGIARGTLYLYMKKIEDQQKQNLI